MKTQSEKLNYSLKKQIETEFYQTVADLKNVEEVKTFLTNFFNEEELDTFSKRLAVAYWLKKGRSQDNIKNNLKVSSTTISTIQKLLQTPGFKLALKNMEAEEWANKWSEKIRRVVRK